MPALACSQRHTIYNTMLYAIYVIGMLYNYICMILYVCVYSFNYVRSCYGHGLGQASRSPGKKSTYLFMYYSYSYVNKQIDRNRLNCVANGK